MFQGLDEWKKKICVHAKPMLFIILVQHSFLVFYIALMIKCDIILNIYWIVAWADNPYYFQLMAGGDQP